MDCRMCSCLRFEPNPWRRSLCRNCHHGFSAHADNADDGGQWYFAKVEGPFSWEQMRHWLQAGYFSTEHLLVRNPRVQGHAYQPFEEAFPDPKRAFLPPGVSERLAAAAAAATGSYDNGAGAASGSGAGMGAGGGVGSPGNQGGKGRAATAADAGVDPDDPYVVEATEAVHEAVADTATVERVSAYFNAGQQWYFIDADGATQGPFTGEVMTSWYKAGYFWNDAMLVCHHGWDAYVTLASILQSADELDTSGQQQQQQGDDVYADANEDAQHRDTAAGGQAYAYDAYQGGGDDAAHRESSSGDYDDSNEDDSDSDSDGEDDDDSAGGSDQDDGAHGTGNADGFDEYGTGINDIDVSVGDESSAAAGGGSLGPHVGGDDYGYGGGASAAAAAGEADPPSVETATAAGGGGAASTDKVWLYADENGSAQGPFSAAEMRDWLEWDYFSDTTLVRHVSAADFLTVGELWPTPTVHPAFSDGGWRAEYEAAGGRA